MLTQASKNGFQDLIIRECIYEYNLPNAFLMMREIEEFFSKKGTFTFSSKDFSLFGLIILRSLLVLRSIFLRASNVFPKDKL